MSKTFHRPLQVPIGEPHEKLGTGSNRSVLMLLREVRGRVVWALYADFGGAWLLIVGGEGRRRLASGISAPLDPSKSLRNIKYINTPRSKLSKNMT